MTIKPLGDPNQDRAIFEQFSALPIPNFAFNSFTNSVTTSEIASILAFGSRPLAMLIMSPVIAKSFAIALQDAISQYEKETGQPVLSIQELSARKPGNP